MLALYPALSHVDPLRAGLSTPDLIALPPQAGIGRDEPQALSLIRRRRVERCVKSFRTSRVPGKVDSFRARPIIMLMGHAYIILLLVVSISSHVLLPCY